MIPIAHHMEEAWAPFRGLNIGVDGGVVVVQPLHEGEYKREVRARRGTSELLTLDGRVCDVTHFEKLVEVTSGLEGMKWPG